MITHWFLVRTTAFLATLMLVALVSGPAAAHCDSMGGPVVKDAQIAIANGKIDPVLKWVGADDEAEIRDAFQRTLAVRGESDAARYVADQYFFETLVRVHRATEGEGFTGLMPAGSVDPAIAAADRALENGNVEQLADDTAAAIREGIRHRFTDAYAKRKTAEQSVEQGRQYVQAYVEFTHFVEGAAHLVSAGPSHKHLEVVAETRSADAAH
ncbi:MAG TPA: DUF6448 family protein [Woeseiaceae bacterium]|nr:DUF6448 family protein [Woeseiaceae bacterium]